MDNPRALALKSLVKTEINGVFSNLEINTTLERSSLSLVDKGLYTALYLGVIEKKMLLDYVIKAYSSVSEDKIDTETLNALRLGVYQLLFMDKIPDYSSVDQSVELAPKKAKGFVNAILRSFLRDNKRINYPQDKWQRLSVEYSYPMEIIELLKGSYGDDVAYSLITDAKREKGISLRVNTVKASVKEVIAILEKRGDAPNISPYTDDIVKTELPIFDIKDLINSGFVFVQDEASRICSRALNASAYDKVLDACACPGGKSFSISIDMENKGELIACDLHKNKLSLITKGARRLGIDIIKVMKQNGKECNERFVARFDKVLCDVPCSGLGIILKKPDIKYKSIESIDNLPRVQYDILSNCANYVKIGGVLVYSTCTLNKNENESNVIAFLKNDGRFLPIDFEINDIKSENGMYTFMPHINKTDGFFVAKMKRIK